MNNNNPFWGDDDQEGWYHIRARCIDIFKPNGKVIQFWLWGTSKSDIKNKVLNPDSNNQYRDIEWIRKEEPPFT
tara:strand:- start:7 stop:228 length:222 start_codon:yes stop_codon:yes gene_type:complete